MGVFGFRIRVLGGCEFGMQASINDGLMIVESLVFVVRDSGTQELPGRRSCRTKAWAGFRGLGFRVSRPKLITSSALLGSERVYPKP